MNKWFWGVLILSFVLINERTIDWLLAITVGGYGFEASIKRTFLHSSPQGYFFSATFRLIPYLLLACLAMFQGNYYSVHEKIAFWTALAAITLFHSWGFGGLSYPLYTGEHLSSTAALALIFIPLNAVWVGLLTGVTMGLLSLMCACIIKRYRI